jgi:RHS repeat-associated protein
MTYNSAIGSYTYPTPGTARPHAVQTAGSRSYAYDAAGRMTSRNGQVIQWNGDGKPSSIGSVQFTYGGTGNRLKKISGSNTTRYVNGNYEIAPNGTVTKYLIGGKQVGTAFFVNHSDHLGSIQAVTDASGIEVRRQDHTPFGDQHYASGSHAESKGWIGEREEETELVYLNARYYDPEIGRFTAPDPIVRLGQKLNRYAYVSNNPTNLYDPSGLEGECPTAHCETVNVDGNLPPEPPGTPLPNPLMPGVPLNGLLFNTDAAEDLARRKEEDDARAKDNERHECVAKGFCLPDPNADDDVPPAPGGDPTPPPLKFCEKHPDRCGGGGGAGEDPGGVVFDVVTKTLPGVTFDPAATTYVESKNGHATFTVLGRAEYDPLGGSQSKRFDNRIGDGLFSLHVKNAWFDFDTGTIGFRAHIDRGNPIRDVAGFFEHLFVDVIGGFLFHHNDSGLDP